jgi:PIN domain nuclease of toxin-antitoxin system
LESRSYLDTHVVLWLSAGRADQLSDRAEKALLSAKELRISPMVELELHLLYEIDRVHAPPAQILTRLGAQVGLAVCDAPFGAVVREAASLVWTRDPFDRLIVAQAMLVSAPLLTKDALIRKHYPKAVW